MIATKPDRSEQEVFHDLEILCSEPGYIHALARISVRDNIVVYASAMSPEALAASYDPARTIRTEFTTLIGLMLKGSVDFEHPGTLVLRQMIERTHSLLEELHECLRRPMMGAIIDGLKTAKAGLVADESAIFSRADVMREPIFYGGESAYAFQYRDLAPRKYARDDAWLRNKRGFSIAEASAVINAAASLPSEKLLALLPKTLDYDRFDWISLPGFILSVEELAAETGIGPDGVRAVLDAFTAPNVPTNEGFMTLGDFNVASAQPLLRAPNGGYVSLQTYVLIEALYDSPFYWMGADKTYNTQAFTHRGAFTEEFVADRLATVFGSANVHRGVTVSRGRDLVTDIDVLVTFADRAIVLQCKAKRLTLEARRGNDQQLRDDFKKAVQDAYGQAHLSAVSLGDSKCKFTLQSGDELKVTPPRTVYPVCVVADHYPALTIQARQFLTFETDNVVRGPLATDVFMIDTMSEMLVSPLRFLSYLDRRVELADRIIAVDEHAVLGFHLSKNLWVDPRMSLTMIADEFAIDLDTAMMVRREGLPGRSIPKGLLDRFESGIIGRVLTNIEQSSSPALLNLGFELLTLSDATAKDLGKGLEQVAAQTTRDGAQHDFTMIFEREKEGITVHCSPLRTKEAVELLKRHCEHRKYLQRADCWFGLLVRGEDGLPIAGVELRFPWQHNDALDAATSSLAAHSKPLCPQGNSGPFPRQKIGRNDRCPCGSGLKFKKCHGR